MATPCAARHKALVPFEFTPLSLAAGGHEVAALTLRWTFERADLADAIRGQPAFRRLRRLRPWLLLLVLLLCALFALQPTWSNGRSLILPLWVALLLWTMPRLVAWLQWRANPQLHGARMEVTVSATGLRVQSPGSVSDSAWEVFRQVHETDHAFLLGFSPKASSPVLVLPKRAVTGKSEIAALGGLLRRRIDGSKTATSDKASRRAP